MNEPKLLEKEEVRKEISIIDICSGIGMSELAMKRAINVLNDKYITNLQLNIEAICEIDEKAAKAFQKMHGLVVNLEDVTKTSFRGK